MVPGGSGDSLVASAGTSDSPWRNKRANDSDPWRLTQIRWDRTSGPRRNERLLVSNTLAPGMAPKARSRCSISLSYLVGRTGFEPVTSSVSGNAIYRSRFRIFILKCCARSMHVRWRPSMSAAIVTQLVTWPSIGHSGLMKRPRGWRGYVFVLAPLLTVLTALLGVVANVATGIIPKSWTWAHDPQIVWIAGAVLLVAILSIVIIQQSISAQTNINEISREGSESAKSSIITEDKSQTINLVESPSSTIINATDSTINLGQSRYSSLGRQINANFGHNPVNPERIWNVPPRLGLFSGRDLLISRLHEELSVQDTATVCTLFGLGGVGKTRLAIEYANRYADKYSPVWWISADEPHLIAQQYAVLGTRLEIINETSRPHDNVSAVQEYLRQHKNWLLIFDNVDKPADIASYIPAGQGRVIVTSRTTVFGSLGKTLAVDVLDRSESINFLTHRLARVDQEHADQLADLLGDLPLALEQAAAYLDSTQLSVTSYIDMWRIRSEELLSRGEVLGHEHTVATVWDLSVERAARDQPATADLIKLCSFLGPNIIPSFLFSFAKDELTEPLHSVVDDDLFWADTIGAIARYSLCQTFRNDAVIILTFHRLVQAATRRKMSKEEKTHFSNIVLRLLFHDAPGEIARTPEDWPWWYVFLQHVLFAVEQTADFATEKGTAAWLLTRAATYLKTHGRPAEARPLFERALAIAEVEFGKKSPRVAEILDDLSETLAELGEVQKAMDVMTQCLTIVNEAFEPQSLQSILYNISYARRLQSAGNLQESRRVADKCLARIEADSDTLSSQLRPALMVLASVLFDLGEVRRASLMIERALRLDAEESEVDVAIMLNNLAAALLRDGDDERAAEFLTQSLYITQNIYGPNHPDVAATLNNLAVLKRDQHDFTTAKELLERALRITEESFGTQSSASLSVLNNLAAVTRASGDSDEAEILYTRAVEIGRKVYGPSHPDLGKIVSNLSVALMDAGKLYKARPAAAEAVKIAETCYGTNHPNVAMRLFVLATIQRKLGDVKQAARTLRRCIRIVELNRDSEDLPLRDLRDFLLKLGDQEA